MGSATSDNTNAGDMLVAKRDYHEAKAQLYELQLRLKEALDNVSDEQRLGTAGSSEHSRLQDIVHDTENMLTLQQAAVDNASRAVGRLIAKQDRRRKTLAGHISDLLFSPGSGLVDFVLIDETETAPLTPTSFLNGWFEARSSGDDPSSLFGRPIVISSENFPPKRESFFESGRRLFGEAAALSFGDMWDKMNADRAADAAREPNPEDSSGSGLDPAS